MGNDPSEGEKNSVKRNELGHFLPGTGTLNPGGRPRLPEEIREFARASREEIFLTIHECQFMSEHELSTMQKNKNTPFIKRMILGVMVKAAQGDSKALDCILNRILGKPVERVKLEGSIEKGASFDEFQKIMANPRAAEAIDVIAEVSNKIYLDESKEQRQD